MAELRRKYVRARNLLILLWITYPFIGLAFMSIAWGRLRSRALAFGFFFAYVLLLVAMLVRALRARIRWKRSAESVNGRVL
jgi:hypothetical protein